MPCLPISLATIQSLSTLLFSSLPLVENIVPSSSSYSVVLQRLVCTCDFSYNFGRTSLRFFSREAAILAWCRLVFWKILQTARNSFRIYLVSQQATFNLASPDYNGRTNNFNYDIRLTRRTHFRLFSPFYVVLSRAKFVKTLETIHVC